MKLPSLLLFLFIALLLTQGCSSISTIPIINEKSAVPRTQSIGILGVRWVETYNDTDTKAFVTRTNEDLFKDKENIAFKKLFPGKTILHEPLTYFANFQFTGKEQKTDKEYIIRRYDLDLIEYFPYTIHSFAQGSYRFNFLRMDQYKLFLGTNEDPMPEKDRKYNIRIPLPEISWNLQSGEMAYLGDITFFIKTEKMSFGIPPAPVVKNIKFERITFSNKYNEMIEVMKKDNPWLPTGKIKNLAKESDWQWNNDLELWKPYQTPEDAPKRDTKKFFF